MNKIKILLLVIVAVMASSAAAFFLTNGKRNVELSIEPRTDYVVQDLPGPWLNCIASASITNNGSKPLLGFSFEMTAYLDGYSTPLGKDAVHSGGKMLMPGETDRFPCLSVQSSFGSPIKEFIGKGVEVFRFTYQVNSAEFGAIPYN